MAIIKIPYKVTDSDNPAPSSITVTISIYSDQGFVKEFNVTPSALGVWLEASTDVSPGRYYARGTVTDGAKSGTAQATPTVIIGDLRLESMKANVPAYGWTDLQADADKFLNGQSWFSNETAEDAHWNPSAVQDDTSPYRGSANPVSIKQAFQWGATIVDCAIAGSMLLGKGNSTGQPYMDKVINYLKVDAGNSVLDFSNTSTWMSDGYLNGDANRLDVAMWASRQIEAWRYARPYASAADRTTIDTYIRNMARWCVAWPARLVQKNYSDGNWRADTTDAMPSTLIQRTGTNYYDQFAGGYLYEGGPKMAWTGAGGMENRQLMSFGTGAAGAQIVGDTQTLADVKKLFFLFLKYYLQGDACDMQDMVRNYQDTGNNGITYPIVAVDGLVRAADALALSGDTSLLTMETTGGAVHNADPSRNTTSTQPKSLKKAIQRIIDIVTRKTTLYAVGHGGDATYILDFQTGSDSSGNRSRWSPAFIMGSWSYLYPDLKDKLLAIGNWTDPGLPPKGTSPDGDWSEATARHGQFTLKGDRRFIGFNVDRGY